MNKGLRKFRNALALMTTLDRKDLEEGGVIPTGEAGKAEWSKFSLGRIPFFLRLPEPRMKAFWHLLESRQPENLKGEVE